MRKTLIPNTGSGGKQKTYNHILPTIPTMRKDGDEHYDEDEHYNERGTIGIERMKRKGGKFSGGNEIKFHILGYVI